MVAAAMVFGSCGGKQQAQVEETQETEKTDVSVFRDQTIYGVCADGTAMNRMFLFLWSVSVAFAAAFCGEKG